LKAGSRVERFDSNNLVVDIEVPSPDPAAAELWLSYADVWHPFWTATVDGVPTRVLKANLAYKAVRVHPGPNRVHFRFHSPVNAFCFRWFSALALAWVLVLAWLVARELELASPGPFDPPGAPRS